jgi:glycine hydroxymethyltransferase
MAALLAAERQRLQEQLQLIPSENYVSRAVMAATGSVLTNKYAEGYGDRRYYNGCREVAAVEELAIQRARQLFGCEHANVQVYSGAVANTAAYMALLRPGDTILAMDLSHGGHLTHGMKLNFSGIFYNAVHYGVDVATGRLDMAAVSALAHARRPRMIVAGASAYPRQIDFAAFAAIAAEVGAYLLADISHIAGLVVSGIHPDPTPLADVVMSTTHKTLRGPRGAVLMCKSKYAKDIDRSVFPGLQSGPHCHQIAAKAVGFLEAMQPEFKDYARRVVANAKVLAEALLARGYELVSGGTDNHLMLVDLTPQDLTGKEAADRLEQAGMVVNKNTVPGETRSPAVTSGIRPATPAVTSRGMGPAEMEQIAAWMDRALSTSDAAAHARIRGEVAELCRAFPIYQNLGEQP